jgi:hypothetical protein
MTPKYRPSHHNGGMDLLDVSALDLIRQLDNSLAEANQGIVAASREAESATQNAHLAAEIRRRFSKPSDAKKYHFHTNGSPFVSPNTAPSDHTRLFQQYEQQQHPYYQTHQPPSSPGMSSSPTHRNPNSRLAVAHADLSAQLEHVRSQLELEMLHHQETKAKLTCAETTISKLQDHVHQLQGQTESMQIAHEQVLSEQREELEQARARAQLESEDAEYAMELAKQKIADEQEMRSLLQQVLEKNEEYRRYIIEQQQSSKKAVSFRDPIDDLSQQNQRALIAMGRELLHKQKQQQTESTTSPSKQTVSALTTCQATAVILKESGQRLGCWEDKETSVSDEVQLERLARNYTSIVELQVMQQRNSIQELESFCALLEQQQTDSAS